jgi:hypothetical protein
LRGEAAPADRGEAKRAECGEAKRAECGEAKRAECGEAKRAERCAPACGDEPRALRVLPANGGDGGAGGKARSGGTFFGTSNVLAAALDAMSAAPLRAKNTKNPSVTQVAEVGFEGVNNSAVNYGC